MAATKEEIKELAEHIYDLDAEVYVHLGSSLGRVFNRDRERCVNELTELLTTRPQGHLVRSELGLIANMARTIEDKEERAMCMTEYNRILNEVMSLPTSFASGDVIDPILAKLNSFNVAPMFQDAAGNVLGIHVFGEVTLSYPAIIECVIILASAFLSFRTTKVEIRRENHFTWGAIHEVAVLFVGIFITMQPALMILKANGAELGITKPFEMFWATGLLSSFLDNTPTYLVFLTTAGALGLSQGMVTALGTVPVKMLEAISCGAVFMGANTYIGNAPNFMVKSIADENGIRMPSFFGYLIWSFGILIPVFLVDMLVFFL